MEPRQLEILGAPLAVREWGTPGGLPIFFWHGGAGGRSGETIGGVAPTLVNELGAHLVALDAPGRGASPARDREAYDVTGLARLLHSVLDAYAIESAVLMGHSWGGAISCRATAVAPERTRALVCFDSGHIDFAELGRFDPAASWHEVRARVTDDVQASIYFGAANQTTSETWPVIAAAEIPLLLLLATEPPAWHLNNQARADRLVAAIPRATLEWREGTNHSTVLTEAGPDVARLVAAWLLSLS